MRNANQTFEVPKTARVFRVAALELLFGRARGRLSAASPLLKAAQIIMSDRLWLSNDNYKGARCGLIKSCPRQYSLADVNASALEWADPAAAKAHVEKQEEGRNWAASRCKAQRGSRHASPIHNPTKSHGMSSGGAWCLPAEGDELAGRKIEMPRGMTYTIPGGHEEADAGLVKAIYKRLLAPTASANSDSPSSSRSLSVLDLGAGVGQFGRSLLSMHHKARYRGYDGSGNIDVLTNGFVKYADMSQPLRLSPRADWVVSLEVAEHLPNQREQFYVRNLHAHACKGIVISWGMLGQGGLSHINNHPPEYVISTFEQLGYVRDDLAASQLVNATEKQLPCQGCNLHVFRRLKVPEGGGCDE